jgi:hypothetical protein
VRRGAPPRFLLDRRCAVLLACGGGMAGVIIRRPCL